MPWGARAGRRGAHVHATGRNSITVSKWEDLWYALDLLPQRVAQHPAEPREEIRAVQAPRVAHKLVLRPQSTQGQTGVDAALPPS